MMQKTSSSRSMGLLILCDWERAVSRMSFIYSRNDIHLQLGEMGLGCWLDPSWILRCLYTDLERPHHKDPFDDALTNHPLVVADTRVAGDMVRMAEELEEARRLDLVDMKVG